jgi:hypothetical protein
MLICQDQNKRKSEQNMASQNEQQQELSEKARQNLQRNAELQNNDRKFIKLQPGEKKILQFNPEKVKVVEAEFDNKNNKRVSYTVTDPQNSSAEEGGVEEKVLPMSLTNAISINALEKGFNLIEIQRLGAGRDTRYTFTPV